MPRFLFLKRAFTDRIIEAGEKWDFPAGTTFDPAVAVQVDAGENPPDSEIQDVNPADFPLGDADAGTANQE